jgi:hypothetical protein
MLEDLAEGFLRGILSSVVRLLFWIVVEVFLFCTGEIVLCAVTLGRRKPRWDGYGGEHMTKLWLLTDLSVLVGLVFWFGVIIAVKRLLQP